MYLCREYFKATVYNILVGYMDPNGILFSCYYYWYYYYLCCNNDYFIMTTITIIGGAMSRCPQVRNSSCNGSGGGGGGGSSSSSSSSSSTSTSSTSRSSRSSSSSSVARAAAWVVVPEVGMVLLGPTVALWLPSLPLGGFVVPWHGYTCFVGYDGASVCCLAASGGA